MVKTIIFDMDGILFDTEKVYDEAWYITLKEKGVKDIDYIISGCRGLTLEDSKRFIDEKCEVKLSGEQCLSDLIHKFDEIIDERGVPIKKGAYELLEYLKENNYEIGLASSTRKSIVVSHLEKAQMLDYFDNIITGDLVHNGKPDPEIYLKSCDNFNRNPKDCIAIEDSINGVTAALRAGMKTIMVPDIVQPTEEIENKLYKKFESLLDVKEFLKNQ